MVSIDFLLLAWRSEFYFISPFIPHTKEVIFFVQLASKKEYLKNVADFIHI